MDKKIIGYKIGHNYCTINNCEKIISQTAKNQELSNIPIKEIRRGDKEEFYIKLLESNEALCDKSNEIDIDLAILKHTTEFNSNRIDLFKDEFIEFRSNNSRNRFYSEYTSNTEFNLLKMEVENMYERYDDMWQRVTKIESRLLLALLILIALIIMRLIIPII